jgi:hypothetical protein
MGREQQAPRLDPASTRAVARVFLFLGFAGLWCSLIHLLTERPVTPVPMLVMASGAAAGFACRRRERPFAAVLNGWDEATAFLGLAAFAQFVVRVTGS